MNPNQKNKSPFSQGTEKEHITLADNSDSEKLDELKKEYSEVKEKKTRKRRKKKKDLAEEVDFAQAAVFSAHLGLQILISRLPKPEPLSKEEREGFDKAFTELAKKYYSKIDTYSEELNFSLLLILILVPRLKKEQKEIKEKENKEKENKN